MAPADPVDTAELVHRLCTWVGRLMPPGPRRGALTAALTTRFRGDHTRVDAAVCRRIEQVAWAHSRHLALAYDPAGTAPPDEVSHGWSAPDPDQVRARAGSVTEVRRLPDGACLLRVDALDPVALAQPYLDAAFTLARGCSRLLLDLRANGGGDPATLALIAGWLLGDEARQLSEVAYHDRVRQWWTPDRPAGSALRQPAAVLLSAHTFSSGEALAYHLRARERVTTVGERTPGAADHITPIQLAATVVGYLPEAVVVDAVTGANWEGTGVVPDVDCSADAAVETALGLPLS